MISTWAAIRTTGTDRDCKNEERKLKAVYEELRRHPARYHRALDGIVIYERMSRHNGSRRAWVIDTSTWRAGRDKRRKLAIFRR